MGDGVERDLYLIVLRSEEQQAGMQCRVRAVTRKDAEDAATEYARERGLTASDIVFISVLCNSEPEKERLSLWRRIWQRIGRGMRRFPLDWRLVCTIVVVFAVPYGCLILAIAAFLIR